MALTVALVALGLGFVLAQSMQNRLSWAVAK